MVLRQSVKRLAGPISAAKRLDNFALNSKKRRRGGDTVYDLTGLGIEHQSFRTNTSVVALHLRWLDSKTFSEYAANPN